MKSYTFEFDDDKLKLKLFFFSLITFIALFIGLIVLNFFNFFFLIVISLGIPVFVFWLNMKKIKKIGSAELANDRIKFNLNGYDKEIYFNEVSNYFINSYNGSSLSLKLKNGKRFGVISNIYFSNPINFTKFCNDFEMEIEKYKKENDTELIKEKSFFEQSWIFPFLIIFTIIVLALVGIAIYKGKNFTAPFFGAIGSLLTVWGGYFSGKRKASKLDNRSANSR